MEPTGHSDLFEALRDLDLPVGDYAIFGSGPLIVRGIIDATNDLDIITRGSTWAMVQDAGEQTTFDDGNPCVTVHGGRLTFGITWKYGHFDLDELIDTAEVIAGLPFVRLEHVIRYKRAAGRPKDLDHLVAMERAGITT